MDKELNRLAKRMLRLLHVRNASADVFLLPHRDIAALKRRFLKKRTEPNVLSFPEPQRFPHPETKKRLLGEIYLNRGLLAKDPERAVPLLAHGLLHLLGYNHKKASDAGKMARAEERLVTKLAAPQKKVRRGR